MPSLPVELWLEVFRWATLTRSSHALYATKYCPFETSTAAVYHDYDEAKWTKRALSLVCKRWRAWTAPLLYEDIVLPLADLPLNRMLLGNDEHREDETAILPCAHWVRRVRLPYSSTIVNAPPPFPIEAVRVLESCYSVEVLVRTTDTLSPLAFEFDTGCPPLPSLKRLDWWHHNDAARTGGINSLPHVLKNAPNIEYLSIGGEMWPHFLNEPAVHLSHLSTLHLRRLNAFFVLQMSRWSLPSLQHVIFDQIQNADIYWPFWQSFGAQIRTVELGVSLKFYVHDFLPLVFSGCPKLEELNYHVLFTRVPRIDRPQESIATIGLHALSNGFFRVGSPEFWSHLRQHFEAFTKQTFPALRRIKLYGEWAAVANDGEFEHLAKPLHERGCVIEMA
ncbi:hypothetical protein BN946_scf185014.g35 [Trametes cinnabarina]|uniref:Uncharacterized protein n=1 Tax=Pycnoporus cinnabarinus TaxID=5643 RepID=A0A060SGN6_PYCCI|nr:hypothetical protein BN946_scf185014.g35 [Trametes cinnabarina]